jgi:hypothetical protein
MSFSLSFFTISPDDLAKVDDGALSLLDYERSDEATLDFYTQDFIDVVMSEMLPLSVLMTEGDERYSGQIDGGIYYGTSAIDEILDAFSQSDLNELADMLEADREHFMATLNNVKALFEKAKTNGQLIIAYF